MLEKSKERIQAVKDRFNENKKLYLYAASGVVVGTLIGAMLKTKPTPIVITVAPVFNNYPPS